jgi:hypothetical protein
MDQHRVFVAIGLTRLLASSRDDRRVLELRTGAGPAPSTFAARRPTTPTGGFGSRRLSATSLPRSGRRQPTSSCLPPDAGTGSRRATSGTVSFAPPSGRRKRRWLRPASKRSRRGSFRIACGASSPRARRARRRPGDDDGPTRAQHSGVHPDVLREGDGTRRRRPRGIRGALAWPNGQAKDTSEPQAPAGASDGGDELRSRMRLRLRSSAVRAHDS